MEEMKPLITPCILISVQYVSDVQRPSSRCCQSGEAESNQVGRVERPLSRL